MNETQKEFSKFGIDVGKEVLKEIIKAPEEEFIEYAKKCCIQKITIDVYCSNLYYYVYFNFLGGDIIRFCDMFRIKVLSGSENKIFESSIIDKGLVHVWHNEFNF
ncbi:MAG: hypothetical protein E7062_09710 [Spirochaetaceae bacterium]|nr:hypothetical protein [Spirochaetaceae bacterium]